MCSGTAGLVTHIFAADMLYICEADRKLIRSHFGSRVFQIRLSRIILISVRRPVRLSRSYWILLGGQTRSFEVAGLVLHDCRYPLYLGSSPFACSVAPTEETSLSPLNSGTTADCPGPQGPLTALQPRLIPYGKFRWLEHTSSNR